MFTNDAFVDDSGDSQPTFRNNGFLNKRPGNPANELHRTLDSMIDEIDGANFKKRKQKSGNKNQHGGTSVIHVIPEELKGRKFKELSAMELEELGEINASQDRFRHRFTEDDYKRDIINATADIRWID